MNEPESGAIVRGVSVSPGLVTGPVKIVMSAADVDKVESGDIMVVKNSSPVFAIGVMNSAGLICEGGGMLTHVCIVSMEMGIPCIADAKNATATLKDKMVVILDATNGAAYDSVGSEGP